MNNIDNSFNALGQPWITSQDLDFMQYGIRDNTAYIIESLIGSNYNPALSYIIKGCVLSSAGGNTTITAGYIFGISKAVGSMSARTYLYKVDTVTFADPAGGNVVIGTVTATPASYDPVDFADGSNHSIHNEYKVVFSSGAANSSDINYLDLIFIPSIKNITSFYPDWQAVVGAAPPQTPKCYLSSGFVKLSGQIVTNANPPSALILTLPAGYRPLKDTYFVLPYYQPTIWNSAVVVMDQFGNMAFANSADKPTAANWAIVLDGINFPNQ